MHSKHQLRAYEHQLLCAYTAATTKDTPWWERTPDQRQASCSWTGLSRGHHPPTFHLKAPFLMH